MMLTLALLLSLAQASPKEDLRAAANAELPEAARMEAFDRLVRTGLTDIAWVSEVAATDKAEARERWVAVRVLGKVGGDRAKNQLVALLSDDMPAMRAAAAQSLGDLGEARQAQALTPLLRDPALIVRAAAAEALGKLRDPVAVAPLGEALSARDNYYRGSSLWVRRHYVKALGQIGSRKAVPTLVRCLDDADEAVASEAVLAFEGIAGFDYREGRELGEQKAAWRRWASAQGK
jgi:hypothetical protein